MSWIDIEDLVNDEEQSERSTVVSYIFTRVEHGVDPSIPISRFLEGPFLPLSKLCDAVQVIRLLYICGHGLN